MTITSDVLLKHSHMQMSKAQSQAITAEVHAGSVSLSMGPLPNIQEIAVTPKMPRIVSNLSTPCWPARCATARDKGRSTETRTQEPGASHEGRQWNLSIRRLKKIFEKPLEMVPKLQPKKQLAPSHHMFRLPPKRPSTFIGYISTEIRDDTSQK